MHTVAAKRAFRAAQDARTDGLVDGGGSKKAFRQARKTGFLSLPARGLTTFPDEACHLQDSMEPDEKVWECVDLVKIDLSHNEIMAVPHSIALVTGLLWLKLCQNKLTSLPPELFSLSTLAFLDVSNNALGGGFSEKLGQLTQLKEIILSGNKLTTLPDSIGQLHALEVLRVEDNLLCALPTTLGALEKLTVLTAQGNQLESVPQSMSQLRALANLDLSKNKLSSLQGCLQQTRSLKFLDLRQNRLVRFPELPLEACGLDQLFLGFNQLEVIDETSLVRAQHHLTVLDLRDNKLLAVPDGLALLYRLKTLDLTNNDLSDLPPGLGYLKGLNHILVDGNSMRAIRRSVLSAGCEALKKYLRTRGKPPVGVDAMDEETDEFTLQAPSASGIDNHVFMEAAASGSLDLTSQRLTSLTLSKTGLCVLPDELGLCLQLTTLVAEDCRLEALPMSALGLPHLVFLRLRKNSLTEHAFAGAFHARMKLKELDVRNNALSMLPSNVHQLSSLNTLLLSFNRLSTLAGVPWRLMKALSIVSASDNKLTDLGTIYEAPALSSLSVENNSLQAIPAELGLCPKLKALYISGNPQRTVRIATVNKGTDEIMSYLKNKLLPEDIAQILAARELDEQSAAPPPSPVPDRPKPTLTPAASAAEMTRATTTREVEASPYDAPIAALESQLEDPGLSAAKRYALKKDLAKARAEKIRFSRKLA
ncbi:hypothetical protein SPRG_05238 [Saprolegnia parasitica CBS 223.65]|uniref:Disease resistance R13L4/SHOC-2-like LRR domain-containing protein n=1 Tax=Saprolegnia parasitica (strain CBS 223.65) TaxID=695850 RepID=A0A067CTD1_SAPPC|nr:hypothetical protein SPRG_05238 [Saprolegnia parasitica CBS 223.65]KDO30047.1 hypothetical protein SPRG_05238 [Saprolegnia parasitica CBS 223.65]|eukprot:XP_012199228.1 hypothetical protein SPRG_05238 [Saprolegnia parasitica CBS 223.65]